MTDIDKIKTKLKKLFALSRSSNANEAAIALEMAQKLMIEYNIKRNEVGEFEVVEENIKGSGNIKPPLYEGHLISNIATAFGCSTAYGYQREKKSASCNYSFGYYGFTFIGLEHRVKIAIFITEVLFRKIKKARIEYLKKLTKVSSKKNKIKRADEFCLGWSFTVVDKLNLFTNTNDEQKSIDNYITNLKWGNDLKTISRGSIKKSSINDFLNGRIAGADIEIQSGIEKQENAVYLLG